MKLRDLFLAGAMMLAPTLALAADPILAVAFVNKTAIDAKVSAVDAKARTITLVGPKGNSLVLNPGPEMQNFDQVKVGDIVVAAVEVTTEITVVPPADGAPAPSALQTLDTAPKGAKPGFILTDQRVISATITAIAADTRTVTLTGPAGNSLDVKVPEEQDGFKKLSVGDRVIFRQLMIAGVGDLGKK